MTFSSEAYQPLPKFSPIGTDAAFMVSFGFVDCEPFRITYVLPSHRARVMARAPALLTGPSSRWLLFVLLGMSVLIV